MDWITDLDDLHSHYGLPGIPAMVKVTDWLTPSYRAFIDRSRFCIFSTVGPEGTDGSPRGDQGPVVTALDDRTLAMPDWKGNERIDSLRNVLRDGRVSLIFLIPGSTSAIRVNGTARLTADADLRGRFQRNGILPRTVIVIAVAEVYSQCSRALQRSELWTEGDRSGGLPTVGDMLADATATRPEWRLDGQAYDAERAVRVATTSMW